MPGMKPNKIPVVSLQAHFRHGWFRFRNILKQHKVPISTGPRLMQLEIEVGFRGHYVKWLQDEPSGAAETQR